jgi:hypothetical protein
MKQALGVEFSLNKKLGGLSTTYTPIGSCPDSCPLKKANACYGNSGPINYVWQMVKGNDDRKIALAEAAAILGLTGKRDLRIHTLGDCRTNRAAKIVAKAAEEYMGRHDRKAFSFTHAWRDVNRESWGKVSILASCETTDAVRKAQARGYATAMIVAEHKQDTAYEQDGLKLIPCPEQTGRCNSCAECRLCMNDSKLKASGATIAFKAHGPTRKVKAVLEELG